MLHREFAALALAGPCLWVACATAPANTVAPGHVGAPGVRSFLVCAPNTALALPAGLQQGMAPVRAEIEAYLQHHGRQVEWVDLPRGRQLWSESLARAKQQGAIGKTVEIFAAELAREFDFQAIVMPSILLHQVRATASNARWDGVKRRMRTVNAPRRAEGRSRDTLADGIAFGDLSGDMPVTSLHLMVFTREGKRIFEGRGGLEFVHEIDMEGVKKSHSYELSLRDDLFQDPEVLREGVAIAFEPYLEPPLAP